MIVRALNGLKSASQAFQRHLADCVCSLGYKSHLADPAIWYKACTWKEDNIDNDQFPVMHWKAFYGNVEEPIPSMPQSAWANQ
ncbi:hypothetical protein ACHAXS_000508 [Conticribra weissflogii]